MLVLVSAAADACSLDAHGHQTGSHLAHGPEGSISQPPSITKSESKENPPDLEGQRIWALEDSILAQTIGIAILEFGVALHR